MSFSLVFTNSSTALGLPGFRVRVSVVKGLTNTNLKIDSGILDSVIAGSSLRFHPLTEVPRYWVMGRPLPPFVIQAVDALDTRYVTAGPNLPRRPNEVGFAEYVIWNVDPLPTSGGFPLTFSTGKKEDTLVRGEATFVTTFSTPRDGDYSISVVTSQGSKVAATPAQLVYFQSAKEVLMSTLNFGVTASPLCALDCLLPNSSFALTTNGVLNTSALRPFNITIFIADSKGVPVRGENQSFIMVRLIKPILFFSELILSVPPTYIQQEEVFFVRAEMGRALFLLAFLGSTLDASTGQHTPVKLEFSCPRLVPAGIANTKSDFNNPCASSVTLLSTRTLPIRVFDPSVPAAVYQSAAVLLKRPIVRIPTAIVSLSKFNASDFKLELAKRMMIKFPFVNSDNALSVIELTSCEVSRQTFGNADLGTSVCGSSGLCNGANRVCPTGVITCACNIAPTLSALLGRFLLQNSPPFSDTTQVQVEATYNLRNAVGFPAFSEQAIADAYAALGLGTLDILKTDSMFAAAFGVDRANVGVR